MSIKVPSLPQEMVVKSADFTAGRFLLEFREQAFLVVGSGDRLNVFAGTDQWPVGSIRPGSPTSGAIWKSGECIGEYIMDQAGGYVVTEIKTGFKTSRPGVRVDPLVHLLKSVAPLEARKSTALFPARS